MTASDSTNGCVDEPAVETQTMSPGEFFDAHPIAYGLALAGSVGASVAAATLAGRAASRAQATGLQFLAAITTAEAIGIVISRRAASAHAKTQPLMLV